MLKDSQSPALTLRLPTAQHISIILQAAIFSLFLLYLISSCSVSTFIYKYVGLNITNRCELGLTSNAQADSTGIDDLLTELSIKNEDLEKKLKENTDKAIVQDITNNYITSSRQSYQTLSIAGNQLSISSGNTITLPSTQTNQTTTNITNNYGDTVVNNIITTSTTFRNGLTAANNVAELGGTLIKDSTIVNGGFDLTIIGTGNIGIGKTNPNYKLEVIGDIKVGESSMLILGSAESDMTGVDGSMYYNSTDEKFRCYQNNTWTDCIGSGGGGGNPSWELTGNSGTTAGTNFVGTTDSQALVFKTNSTERMRLTNDGALLLSGSAGSTPTSGIGTRMMWVPSKSAFRIGTIDGNGALIGEEWDDSYIGEYSFAQGLNSIARSYGDVAMGENSYAAGGGSFALGASTSAFGFNSVAIGQYSTANGDNSVAMIGGTTNGSFGIAIGSSAESYLSGIAIGSGTANGGVVLGAGTSGPGGVAMNGGNASGFSSFALGDSTSAQAERALALGSSLSVTANFSSAIGHHLAVGVNNAMVIGSGIFGGANLTNSTQYSIAMGSNSNLPTFFIGPSSGQGTTGNVGIGTTLPTSKLQVMANLSNEYSAKFFNDGNDLDRYGLLIQTGLDDQSDLSSSTLIQFNDGDGDSVGAITFANNSTNYGTSSDRRLKDNIVNTSLGIDDLMKIRITDYTWKSDRDNKLNHGVIAQELFQVYPDAVIVHSDPNKMLMVDYSKLTPLMVKSIQDTNIKLNDMGNVQNTSILSLKTNVINTTAAIRDINLFISSQSAELQKLASKNEDNSAKIATNINRLDEIISRLDGIYTNEATPTGKLADLASRIEFLEKSVLANPSTDSAVLGASSSGSLFSNYEATISALMITNTANINDLTVIGDMKVGLLSTDGLEGSLDALGTPLKLQKNQSGPIEFMGNKVEMNQAGDINIKEGNLVIEKGIIKANSNIRGINHKVNEGQTELTIVFTNPHPSDQYAVTVSPSWLTTVAVTQKSSTGFKILFGSNAPANSSCDWIIID